MRGLRVLPAAVRKVFLVCAALSLACAAAAAQRPSRDELKVVNHTRSLEVLSVEHRKDELLLTFRNNYAQPLTGVVVSTLKGWRDGVAYPSRGERLAPGATRTASFYLPESKRTREVVVLAAFLEDCTIDASPEFAAGEQARRAAEKEQNEKSVALLAQTLGAPDFEPRRSLDRLEREAHALADKAADAKRDEVYSSRLSAGTFLWSKVMDVQKALKADKGFDVRGALTNLKALLEAKRNSC